MDQAGKVMERIMDVVVNDQEVNEVHGPDGKPLASFWYKSEAPLTWNAGMILYASRIYNEKLHADVNPLSMLEGIMD
jgi:hypothetical protein